MVEDVAGYPIDILKAAIVAARRHYDWLPSIAEMVQICDDLVAPRRRRLRALGSIEQEHERRRREQDRRREIERSRREHTEQLERMLVEKFGADAPAPGDYQAAWDAIHYLISLHAALSWNRAIEAAERWAAKATRFMSIVRRTIELERAGLIDAQQLQILAHLSAHDEPGARSFLDDVGAGRVERGKPSRVVGDRANWPRFEQQVRQHYWSIVDALAGPDNKAAEAPRTLDGGGGRPVETSPGERAEILRRVRAETASRHLPAEDDPKVREWLAAMDALGPTRRRPRAGLPRGFRAGQFR